MINKNIIDTNHFAKQLRAAGHPERLRILLHLLNSEYSIQELTELTHIDANIIANHLSKMRQLDMVDYTRFYRILQYRIISETLKQTLMPIQHQIDQRNNSMSPTN